MFPSSADAGASDYGGFEPFVQCMGPYRQEKLPLTLEKRSAARIADRARNEAKASVLGYCGPFWNTKR
jgi:hypothetical protein